MFAEHENSVSVLAGYPPVRAPEEHIELSCRMSDGEVPECCIGGGATFTYSAGLWVVAKDADNTSP